MTGLKRFTRSPFMTLKEHSQYIDKLNPVDTDEEINRGQTGDKPETIGRQTEDKLETIGRQTGDNKEPILQETGDKPRTEVETIGRQKGDNRETNHQFSSLVGLQKALVIFIYNECKMERAKITKSLSLEYISSAINAPYSSVKKTLQRLQSKQFIKRGEFKVGRGGWSKYLLSETAFREVLQYETGDKRETIGRQLGDKLESQPRTSAPVVSSSYINTTTNNLEGIDFSSLAGIGFSQSHLLQIDREYQINPNVALPKDTIQESIEALAFDLKHNKDKLRFKNDPVTVLISLLRQGKPYSSVTPGKFKTPRQEALDLYLSEKEQREKLEHQTIERIKNLEYEKWLNGLEEDELLGLYPESEIQEGLPAKIRKTVWRKKALEMAKDYFNAEIWPSRKGVLPIVI